MAKGVLNRVVIAVLFVPLASWAYHRFIYYPVEVERHNRGEYSLVAYAEPSSFNNPIQFIIDIGLVFGSIHNNTQIAVALFKDKERLGRVVLVSGEDLPEDHLPLAVIWGENEVTVSEKKHGLTVQLYLVQKSI